MGLRRYVIKRVITGTITVLAVVVLIFFLFRLPTFLQGIDPSDLYINPELPAQAQEALRQHLGLPPKNATFDHWFGYFVTNTKNLLTFDFGLSFRTFRPVTAEISDRLPNTLLLLGTSIGLSIVLGIALGIKAASRHGKTLDVALVTSSLTTYSMPVFWLGMLLILVLGFYLRLFPISGGTISYPPPEDFLQASLDKLWHMILPATTLVIAIYGGYLLLMRNTLIDVLTEDYIVTARAKGLSERAVLYGHAVRNAFLPMITNIALSVALLWTGATLTETTFNWEGIGRLYFTSLVLLDFPVAEALLYIIALSVVLANIVADLMYGVLDPRVRYD